MDFLSELFNRFDARLKLSQNNIITVKISGDAYELLCVPALLKQYYSKKNLSAEQLNMVMEYDSLI